MVQPVGDSAIAVVVETVAKTAAANGPVVPRFVVQFHNDWVEVVEAIVLVIIVAGNHGVLCCVVFCFVAVPFSMGFGFQLDCVVLCCIVATLAATARTVGTGTAAVCVCVCVCFMEGRFHCMLAEKRTTN